jgi:hypothetical protein
MHTELDHIETLAEEWSRGQLSSGLTVSWIMDFIDAIVAGEGPW